MLTSNRLQPEKTTRLVHSVESCVEKKRDVSARSATAWHERSQVHPSLASCSKKLGGFFQHSIQHLRMIDLPVHLAACRVNKTSRQPVLAQPDVLWALLAWRQLIEMSSTERHPEIGQRLCNKSHSLFCEHHGNRSEPPAHYRVWIPKLARIRPTSIEALTPHRLCFNESLCNRYTAIRCFRPMQSNEFTRNLDYRIGNRA